MYPVRVQSHFPTRDVTVASPDLAHAHIVINATPASRRRDAGCIALVPAIAYCRRHHYGAGNYAPAALARSRECQTFGGRVMLEGQADEVMAFFEMEGNFGKPNIP
jgi:hypothetical protein